MPKPCQRQLGNGSRQKARASSETIRSIGQVTAEEFVGAFAAQCNGCLRLRKLGKEPYRQRSGVRARFVGEVGEFFDRSAKILFRREVQLLVVRAVLFCGAMNIFRFVEAAAAEGNRECL